MKRVISLRHDNKSYVCFPSANHKSWAALSFFPFFNWCKYNWPPNLNSNPSQSDFENELIDARLSPLTWVLLEIVTQIVNNARANSTKSILLSRSYQHHMTCRIQDKVLLPGTAFFETAAASALHLVANKQACLVVDLSIVSPKELSIAPNDHSKQEAVVECDINLVTGKLSIGSQGKNLV